MDDNGVGLTVLLLGCGRLGSAVLEGLLTNPHTDQIINRIIVAVRSPKAFSPVENLFLSFNAARSGFPQPAASIRTSVVASDEILDAVGASDVILLACGHSQYMTVLSEIRDACQKPAAGSHARALVSFCGGVTIAQLAVALQNTESNHVSEEHNTPILFRALPNVAARVHFSMTAVSAGSQMMLSSEIPPDDAHKHVDALLKLLGEVMWLPERLMDTAGALCSSSLALFATITQAMADGACGVERDLPREWALRASAAAARGVAELVARGRKPDAIRDEIMTKGGSTFEGHVVMGKLGVAEKVAHAVEVTALAAKGLMLN